MPRGVQDDSGGTRLPDCDAAFLAAYAPRCVWADGEWGGCERANGDGPWMLMLYSSAPPSVSQSPRGGEADVLAPAADWWARPLRAWETSGTLYLADRMLSHPHLQIHSLPLSSASTRTLSKDAAGAY